MYVTETFSGEGRKTRVKYIQGFSAPRDVLLRLASKRNFWITEREDFQSVDLIAILFLLSTFLSLPFLIIFRDICVELEYSGKARSIFFIGISCDYCTGSNLSGRAFCVVRIRIFARTTRQRFG